MIKNRMPLRHLMMLPLFAIIFLFFCFGYGISMDSYQSRDDNVFIAGFAIAGVVVGIIVVGIFMKKDWARVGLKIILFILGAVWTGLAYYWFSNMYMAGVNRREIYLPFMFSFFIYLILFAGISYLNHPKLIDEFEEEEI